MRKGIKFSTAADIADFVVKNMPPKKGGSLQPEEYYAILGFDLSANGVELKEPLTAENAASIVIHPAEPAADAAAAPAATPPDVLQTLHGAVTRALKSPKVVEAYAKQNIRSRPNATLAEARTWFDGEAARWQKIVKEVKVDVAE